MKVENLVDKLANKAKHESKHFSDDPDLPDYPSAFGWLKGEMKFLLIRLNLTEEQQKLVNTYDN